MTFTSRRTGITVLAALTAATALVLTGCTGSPSGSSSSGGVLLASDDGSPTYTAANFNPFSPSVRLGNFYMYEPLEVVNTLDGTSTPFLATGHEYTDPQTLVYTIRDGVTWSDGEPFTPEDVKFTFELVKQVPALDLHGDWQHIDSLEVDGDKVVFHLTAPDGQAAFVLNQQLIVPEHIWADVDDPLTFADDKPVVTGPYTLGSFSPNQYTLVKNPDYWQADKVVVPSITFTADNSQLNIVHKGYDWAYAFLPDVDKTWVGADKEHNSYWFPAGGTVGLIPNLTKAPFSDPEFRLGLSYSLDRQKIADAAEGGYVDAAGQTGLLLPNQKAWLDPSIPDGGEITQDAATAGDHFSKAGYSLTDGKLVDSAGKQVSVSIMTPNAYTDWLAAATAVKTQLEAAGIAVTIQQPQQASYTDSLNNGDFDLAISGYGGTGSVFQDFNTLLNSEFAVPVGQAASANFGRFSDPEADSLLDQLKASTDPDEQKQIAYQLEQIIYTQTPVISMFYGGLWGLFSDKQYTGWPSADNPYAPPSTWNSTPLLVFTNLKKS
jgi:peptide/nickel transport system substrate-binding protein